MFVGEGVHNSAESINPIKRVGECMWLFPPFKGPQPLTNFKLVYFRLLIQII